MRSVGSAIRDAAPWLAVTALIGGVDYVTPSSYAFASMYFIPIFPAAWRSRATGFIVAAASSFAWIFCDIVQRPITDEGAQYWNYSTRIVVFVLAVFLASTLQREQSRIAELDRGRARGAGSPPRARDRAPRDGRRGCGTLGSPHPAR